MMWLWLDLEGEMICSSIYGMVALMKEVVGSFGRCSCGDGNKSLRVQVQYRQVCVL